MSNLQLPDHLLLLLQQATDNYQSIAAKRKVGRPPTYSALSFLLLAITVVVLRTFDEIELHRLLLADADLLAAGGFPQPPHRKTIGRRLRRLVPEAETQIQLLGEQIRSALPVSVSISAIDGRMYQAVGSRWHKRDRQAGVIPPKLRNVDTESAWSKSNYRGWVQGYRLIVQTLVFPCPVPLFAAWVSNEIGESTVAKQAINKEHLHITDVLLGDETFGGADLTALYKKAGGWLLTPKQLPPRNRTWKDDLYEYRKESIELLFQRIIQTADLKSCQVKGNGKNGAFVLANVWLYQLIFLLNLRQQKPLANVKEQVDLARWRIPI
jgi:hypothetical protein